jgi:DNA-binding LacI/PurR family transcriptional regulator
MAKEVGSINEIAELCGVSASTVSRVLNNEPGISAETRMSVLREVQTHNFTLRQRKRPAARKMIGILIILPEKDETSVNPFFNMSDLYEGINNSFPGEKKRLEVVTLSEFRKNPEIYTDNIDGCMFASVSADDETQHILDQQKIPCIHLNRVRGDSSYVSCNNYRGMEHITRHLFSMGHQKIGYLGCAKKEVNQDRLRGYVSAVYTALEAVPSAMILNVESADAINAKTVKFFTSRECTAVVCFSDIFAIRFIGECGKNGIVIPKDISVTGFDNSVLRQNFRPLITTVNLSIYEMSFFAARWLRDTIINRQERTIHLEIDGSLVEGESVRKISH